MNVFGEENKQSEALSVLIHDTNLHFNGTKRRINKALEDTELSTEVRQTLIQNRVSLECIMKKIDEYYIKFKNDFKP